MLRHTELAALLAIGLLAVGCGKSAKEGSRASKISGKGDRAGNKAAASPGPQTPVNRIELFTMTATGPKDKRWQDFKGTFDMKSAILSWEKEEVYFQFSNDPGGCDSLNGAFSTSKNPVRVTVYVPLSPAERKGEVPLDGKTFKGKMAAIYARSFNAMFLMNAETERTVHFVSGRVKPGATIKGWVNVKEKIFGSDKHALIRGKFELKVCKGED